MIDIAGDPSAARQFDHTARNLAVDGSSDANDLADHTAIDGGGVADGQEIAFHIAVDDSVNLHFAIGLQIPGNPQVGADNRRDFRLIRIFLRLRPWLQFRLSGF